MPHRSARSQLGAGALIALIAAANCSAGEKVPTIPPVTAANIAIVSGSSQSGVITLSLAQPLVVRVTDDVGRGVAGYQVLWSVSTGAGSLPVASTTGSDGTASARWVLGSQVGAVTATAGNTALTGATKSVTFQATAIGASVALESGSGQSALTSERLANDFVVRLTDANGNPVFGKTIVWSVSAGGGSLSPISSISAGDGLASTRYTLGSIVGIQTVDATATGFTNSPVAFTAQAQQRPLGAIVSVRDDIFNHFTPTPATIAVGSRVVWSWEGNNFHNVTWVNDPATDSDSPTQQSGVHEVTFLTAGVFDYLCTEDGSTGSIIVN